MTDSDRDDVVAIVAHLTRIVVRNMGAEERIQLASDISAALCEELNLDSTEIAAAAMQQSRAMARPS